MLKNIKLDQRFLRATSSEMLHLFYKPAFAESTLYQRGTAFFSIEFLLGLMDNLVEFVYNGGSMQLITSVELDAPTVRSFTKGYLLSVENVETLLRERLSRYLSSSVKRTQDEESRLDVLANMIAAGRLTMKVATVDGGIYHEKIGVFSDREGNAIAFFGSANETVNAFYHNYETLTIATSWGILKPIVEEYKEHFNNLWTNREPGIQVVDFPQALEANLVGTFRKSPSLDAAIQKLIALRSHPTVTLHKKRVLHDYQQQAIEEFVGNDYRHLFEMATGTGKTFTAVKAIERMTLDKQYLNVVVLVPLVDLQRQWASAISADLDVPFRILKYGGEGVNTLQQFRMSTRTAAACHNSFATIAICVYDSFFRVNPKGMTPLRGDTLLVVDEMHNLTMGNLDALETFSPYRLGLSATPERFSREETERLCRFFLRPGKASFKYDLERAIDAGYLSRYFYYPIYVEFTDEEKVNYSVASKRIAVLSGMYADNPTVELRKQLNDALIARSRIVKKAKNKLATLANMVSDDHYDFHNSVVFCGLGKIDNNGSQEKIVDLATEIIGLNPDKHYFPAKYTSSQANRPARLEGFKQGLTDVLVAIKCFDEGLDVPALDKIYIMSSDSCKRQTIQRRGRVLRISKDTGKTNAYIYDMVVGENEAGVFLPLPTELPRVYEYSRLAMNPEGSSGILNGFDPSQGFDELENDE